MDGPDAPFDLRFKTRLIAPVGSRSCSPDVIRHRYIRAVITPPFEHVHDDPSVVRTPSDRRMRSTRPSRSNAPPSTTLPAH